MIMLLFLIYVRFMNSTVYILSMNYKYFAKFDFINICIFILSTFILVVLYEKKSQIIKNVKKYIIC